MGRREGRVPCSRVCSAWLRHLGTVEWLEERSTLMQKLCEAKPNKTYPLPVVDLLSCFLWQEKGNGNHQLTPGWTLCCQWRKGCCECGQLRYRSDEIAELGSSHNEKDSENTNKPPYLSLLLCEPGMRHPDSTQWFYDPLQGFNPDVHTAQLSRTVFLVFWDQG